jgi:hypothetical protein
MIEDKEGIEEWIGIKTPFHKLRKHTFPFFLLVFLFLSVYLMNVSFLIQDFPQTK